MQKNIYAISLVEIIAVIAIVGLLSVVAVPSYNNYLIESRRQDGWVSLQNVQNRIEEFISLTGAQPTQDEFKNIIVENEYTGSKVNAGNAAELSEAGYYYMQYNDWTYPEYLIVAYPVSDKSQANDADCPQIGVMRTGYADSNAACYDY